MGYRLQIPGYSEPVDWQLVDEAALDVFVDFVVRRIAGYLGKD